MPLEYTQPNTIPLAPRSTPILPEAVNREYQPGFMEGYATSVVDAFALENTGFSLGRSLALGPSPEGPIDTEYDPFTDPDLAEQLEDPVFARSLVHVDNRAQALDKQSRYRQEMQMRSDVAAAGPGGVAALMTAGILDPVGVIPLIGQIGKIERGGKLAKSMLTGGLSFAKAGAIGSTASELALHASQDYRQWDESLWNVGGATLLSGVVGTALPVVTKALSKSPQEIGRMIEQDMAVPDGSLGAARSPKAATTLEDEGLAMTNPVFKAVSKVTRFADPLQRLMGVSSIGARRLVQEMVRNPLLLQKNLKGMESPIPVEEIMTMWDLPRADGKNFVTDAFVRYRTGVAGGRSRAVMENTRDMLGRITQRKDGKLTETEFREEVFAAMSRDDQHVIPEVAEAAAHLRKTIFDPILQRGIKEKLFPEELATMPPKTAQSYISRMYDVDKIMKGDEYLKFKNALAKWLRSERDGAIAALRNAEADEAAKLADDVEDLKYRAAFMDDELDEIAGEIIQNRILKSPDGALPYTLADDVPGRIKPKVGKPGVFKARSLMAPDEIVRPWLIKDINTIMDAYVRQTVPHIELHARFGSADMSKALADISGEYDRLKEAARDKPKKVEQLEKERRAAIRDLAALRDRLLGTYGLPADPTHPMVRASQIARGINLLSKLADVTVSSLPDIARPVMTQGLGNVMKYGMKPFIRNFKSARLNMRESSRLASVVELTMNTRLSRGSDVFDIYGGRTRIERGLRGMTDTFGLVTLIAPWNQVLKDWTAMIARSSIIEQSVKWSDNTITAMDKAKLASSGISRSVARKIAGMAEQVDGVWVFKDDAVEDAEVITALRAALQREVNSTIVTPSAGQKPLWMSTEVGKVIGQFRSYMFASAQSVLLSGLQRADAGQLMGVMMAVAMGGMVYGLKAKASNRPVSDDPATWIVEGIDRAGVTGWFFDANNIIEKMSGNRIGVRALAGAEPSSRFASRNSVGALLGPSFGLMADVYGIGNSLTSGDWSEADTHAVRRMIPYQNFFLFRGIMNKAEEKINELAEVR